MTMKKGIDCEELRSRSEALGLETQMRLNGVIICGAETRKSVSIERTLVTEEGVLVVEFRVGKK